MWKLVFLTSNFYIGTIKSSFNIFAWCTVQCTYKLAVCSVQYTTVQCREVQYSALECTVVKYTTVHCCTEHYNTLQYSLVQGSTMNSRLKYITPVTSKQILSQLNQ